MKNEFTPILLTVNWANQRATCLAYQVLLFLNENNGVRNPELRDYIESLPLGKGSSTVDRLLKYMQRLAVIDVYGEPRGVIYYMTTYGAELLRSYQAHPPVQSPSLILDVKEI